jgi:arginyl-tRNA synthetase
VTPDDVGEAVRAAVVRLIGDGRIPPVEVPAVRIERPRSREHGDYATNIAMALARPARMSPVDLASLVAQEVAAAEGIAEVEVAGPGFINITLASAAQGALAQAVVTAGEDWGRSATLAGRAVNVEFISANPTGPIHLGHTRWAALGDCIARVLEAAGARVTREFYINDRGRQMDLFGASVEALAAGRPVPEDGYHGAYIADLAAAVLAQHPGAMSLPEDERHDLFREEAYRLQLAEQRDVLALFRTTFDVWTSERTLYTSGAVDRGLARLREQGHVFEQDGAVWLRTTDFGDDKDRVLIRQDGTPTYYAADTAYYVDKRARGFDVAIYLLGADHHGYVNRLRAVAACAGDDPDATIDVLIGQMVKITKDGQEVKLSKRAGNIVTLDELISEVGVDAARYTLARYPADSPLTLDLADMVRATNDNPVFYVQYAHARISSVLRNAAELGIDWRDAVFDPALLDHEREGDLLGRLGEFPRVVASSAELREPHRVARYLEDLATAYHRFYDVCWVLPRGDEEVGPLHVARLWLCAAARQTFANGLGLLGVTAPERM